MVSLFISVSYKTSPASRAALGGACTGSGNGTTGLVYESTGGVPNAGTFPPAETLNKQSLACGRLAKPVVPTGACKAPRSPSLSGIRARLPRPGHLRPGLFPSPPNMEPGLFFARASQPKARSRARRRGVLPARRCRFCGSRKTAAPRYPHPTARDACAPAPVSALPRPGSACRPC